MKKILVVFVVVAIALLGATAAMAGISATKHNLSTTGPGATTATAETEICIFCHTPHGGNPAVAPLWNKPANTGTLTAYGTTKAGTLVGAPTTGVSFACMACHDGVSAMGAVLNTSAAGIAADTIALSNATMPAAGSLGLPMNNDHPVAFAYTVAVAGMKLLNATGAGNVVRPVGPGVGTLPLGLSGAMMECSSCHEPHSTNTSFLRLPNTNSDLCLSCHLK